MHIAAVDVDLIPLPAVTPPYAWRRGLRGSHPARTTAVLRITTEHGAPTTPGIALPDFVQGLRGTTRS